ncbi:MAG: LacI family DNA-binding transcriptional regulator [Nitrospiraceae bacterium]|nr:LacI family DNA-binding transcriptional regulator [Nitrospiraceae bacterium]
MDVSKDSRRAKAPIATVTIHDVARVAGVSAKTVSRVINQENPVAAATRARVEKVIRELAYHPHMGARSLRSNRRDCIGVTLSAPLDIVPISEGLLSSLFSQLYRLFGAKGHSVSFDFNPGVGELGADYARGLWNKRYGGLVVLGPLAAHDPIIHRVHESGHPYVTTSRTASLPECCSATVDLDEAAYLSTRYLLNRGHRRIALLSSFAGYEAGDERIRGYTRALLEAGIEFDDRLVKGGSFASHQTAALVHRLLMDPEVTALVESSAGEDADSVRDGAQRAGRVPGGNVDVVCWTYTPNATVMAEACAHVWIPIREVLSEGLEILSAWFDGEREGPFSVQYRPTLYETTDIKEIAKPRPVFDVLA